VDQSLNNSFPVVVGDKLQKSWKEINHLTSNALLR